MAIVRKQQVTVESGELTLVREAGRYLLIQGETAIDVTRVMAFANYPMGVVSLRLRVSSAPRLTLREAHAEPAGAS